MMINDKITPTPDAEGGRHPHSSVGVNDQDKLDARHCPICGSADESHVFADAHFDLASLDEFAFASRKVPEYMHYRLITCPVCDLLYASPAPSLEALARAYRDAGFDSGEEARYASRTYAGYLPAIIRRLPDKDGAIDIGTGDGAFLRELLAAGFTAVAGVEPSAAPIASAQDDVRALIRHDIFRPEDFEPGRYSLITCFQTMEHVHDPLAAGGGVYSRLKDGGAAFFIGHNREGLVNRLLGRKSPIFDIEHLQLFSPRSARALFERAGFVNVEVHRLVNRYPIQYWTKLFPMPKALKLVCLAALKADRDRSFADPDGRRQHRDHRVQISRAGRDRRTRGHDLRSVHAGPTDSTAPHSARPTGWICPAEPVITLNEPQVFVMSRSTTRYTRPTTNLGNGLQSTARPATTAPVAGRIVRGRVGTERRSSAPRPRFRQVQAAP